jgi:hypothetical protein
VINTRCSFPSISSYQICTDREIAHIVFVNPLIPQDWGIYKAVGPPPRPLQQKVSCISQLTTTFIRRSSNCYRALIAVIGPFPSSLRGTKCRSNLNGSWRRIMLRGYCPAITLTMTAEAEVACLFCATIIPDVQSGYT